jgi:hypothetical protein
LHFAVGPTDDGRLYAVTFDPEGKAQGVMPSHDAGATWVPLAATGN